MEETIKRLEEFYGRIKSLLIKSAEEISRKYGYGQAKLGEKVTGAFFRFIRLQHERTLIAVADTRLRHPCER